MTIVPLPPPPPSRPAGPARPLPPAAFVPSLSLPEFLAAVARVHERELERARRREERARVLRPLCWTLVVTLASFGWAVFTHGVPHW